MTLTGPLPRAGETLGPVRRTRRRRYTVMQLLGGAGLVARGVLDVAAGYWQCVARARAAALGKDLWGRMYTTAGAFISSSRVPPPTCRLS